jgi:hypothetical protein
VSSAEDAARLAAQGGFDLDPKRSELVAAQLPPLWEEIGRLATLPVGSTEPASTFSPSWP